MDDDLFISALSLAEIRCGVLEKSAGRKRRQLEERFHGQEDLRRCFDDACWLSTKMQHLPEPVSCRKALPQGGPEALSICHGRNRRGE